MPRLLPVMATQETQTPFDDEHLLLDGIMLDDFNNAVDDDELWALVEDVACQTAPFEDTVACQTQTVEWEWS